MQKVRWTHLGNSPIVIADPRIIDKEKILFVEDNPITVSIGNYKNIVLTLLSGPVRRDATDKTLVNIFPDHYYTNIPYEDDSRTVYKLVEPYLIEKHGLSTGKNTLGIKYLETIKKIDISSEDIPESFFNSFLKIGGLIRLAHKLPYFQTEYLSVEIDNLLESYNFLIDTYSGYGSKTIMETVIDLHDIQLSFLAFCSQIERITLDYEKLKPFMDLYIECCQLRAE